MTEPQSGNAVKERRRGVFLLPNLLTAAGLFAGFFSIISGINGNFVAAVVAVIVAGLLDGLDGRVARLTNTQTDFGEQFDSLSDLVSFGLAPALLAYNWSLYSLAQVSPTAGKLGWLAAFIYAACAALRLARFNTQVAVQDKRYFQGLPSPSAAGLLVVSVWFFHDQGVSGESVRWIILAETVLLGLLMFSGVRYWSFKTWPRSDRVPIAWIFGAVLFFALLAADPPAVLVIVGLVYVASGLIMTVKGMRERRLRRQLRARRASASKSGDES